MKNLYILVALGGVLAAEHASALNLDLTYYPNTYEANPGGEFTMVPATAADVPAFNVIYNRYSPLATGPGGVGFETFCMDTGTEVRSNPLGATLIPGNVTAGTAWLYSEFAHGLLGADGYNYTDTSVAGGRWKSAAALQSAIWYFQGDIASPAAGLATTFVNDAIAALNLASISNPFQLNNGGFGVDELQLTKTGANGGTLYSQPLLALVPDGGLTAMLLGLGMLGITGARRFIKK